MSGPEAQADPNDPEGVISRAIVARENATSDRPDADALLAMDEPLHRVYGAATLVCTLSHAVHKGCRLSPRGLSFLALALEREAERLYRLYFGRAPEGR